MSELVLVAVLGNVRKATKHVCWTVGTQLVVALEPLAHCWNVASVSPFWKYLFG